MPYQVKSSQDEEVPIQAIAEEDNSPITALLTFLSVVLIIVTCPFSLFFCVRIVQVGEWPLSEKHV